MVLKDELGSANGVFMLGKERVREKDVYGHVGIKTLVRGDAHVRTNN